MKKPENSLKTIVWAGFVAGSLDGLAAVFMYMIPDGKNPVNIFYYIASGVFGKTAFAGNAIMALWGIFFHYLIAFGAALVFFLIYPKIKLLSKNKVLMGVIYGICVWLFMNFVILPMSQVPKLPFNSTQALIGIVIHMFLVGLPISLIIHNYYTNRRTLSKKP